MVNRELIRAKALQLVYAHSFNGNDPGAAEKELAFSLSKSYQLYKVLLLLVVAVTKMARKHVEVAEAQARLSGATLPSRRFADNWLAARLAENRQLREFVETEKDLWKDLPEFVNNLYSQITETQPYQDFMERNADSHEDDCELWCELYRLVIERNDKLEEILEEESIYWNAADREVVDSFVVKTMRRFMENGGDDCELLPEYDDDDKRDFARRLIRAAIGNGGEYRKYIGETATNWELSRMSEMDIVIMQLAIAEMVTFANIPLTVTINEYVGLAKKFSSRRSGGYVNGVLDAVARKLAASGLLLKELPQRRRDGKAE